MMRFRSVRFPLRDLGANLTIILLLSFGLGAATLLYTTADRLLLHPFPGIHAETLVRAAVERPQITSRSFGITTYEAMRGMKSLTGVAAESDFDSSLGTANGPKRIFAGMVSGSYFEMLGVRPELGRILTRADEAGSGTVPVVLNHRFWERQFAGSADALGKTVTLAGRTFTIVGVMPRTFVGTTLDSAPELWLPLSAEPLLSRKPLTDPDSDFWFTIVGRLRNGFSISQAQAEFAVVYAESESAAKREYFYPGTGILEPVARGAFYLHDQFARALSLLLWGLLAFLLILSANVAGLLLVRAARRQRETAIRVALGATRSSVMLRVLIESVGLGIAGAAGGVGLAYASAPIVQHWLPYMYAPLPVSLAPDLGITVLAFALALCVSLAFGVGPALRATQVAPQQALRGGQSSRRTGAGSRVLLSVQTALTLVLLVAAGLLIRTFTTLRATNPGFHTNHLITFTFDPSMVGTSSPPSAELGRELLQQVRNLRGVRDASLATVEPMHRIGLKTSVAIPGRRIAQSDFLNTSMNQVSSTFFETLGIPIVSGRVFSEQEAQHAHPIPVVVNEAFARLLFPGVNPLGRTFGQDVPGKVATAKFVVVGVAADAKYRSLRETPPPTYYAPIDQREDWGSTMFLYVRTQGPSDAVAGEVKNAFWQLDARIPLFDIVTMREQIAESLWQERLLASLAGLLALCSILMAAAGLYGLLAYDTNQRTRELGIRTAVGATRHHLAFLLIRETVQILLPGVAAGLIACFFGSHLVAAALYGIRAWDPVSLFAAISTIFLAGIAATWQPLRRALRVDPAVVLRDE